MRAELTAPSVEELLRATETDDRDALDRGRELVNARSGPILELEHRDGGRDVQIVNQCTARLQRVAYLESVGEFHDPSPVKGEGTSAREAELKAIGEAIERYCLGSYDEAAMYDGRFGSSDREMLRPSSLCKFSPRQRRERGRSLDVLDEQEYHWTLTRDLLDGTEVLVPVQLVYLPFPSPGNVQPRLPTTVGGATGTSYLSAVYRGLCEVIERDNFIVSYLNKLPVPRIDLDGCTDPVIDTLVNAFRIDGREVYAFDISLDLPVTTCLSVAIDREDYPAVRVGLGCESTTYEAVVGALVESFRVKPWSGPTEEFPPAQAVDSIPARSRFWADHRRIEELDFLLEREPTVELRPDPSPPDRATTVERLLSKLEADGRDCYVADVTTTTLREYGFVTVKVVVPSLHPLHMTGHRYLGGERLYRTPVETGHLDAPRDEADLHDAPHPML